MMNQLIKVKVNISRQHFVFVVLFKMYLQYASHCIGISHGWMISSIATFHPNSCVNSCVHHMYRRAYTHMCYSSVNIIPKFGDVYS